MKTYRLYHRTQKVFKEVEAESAQEACQKVGWLIGDCWVREKSRGQYSHGWKDVTKRGGQ